MVLRVTIPYLLSIKNYNITDIYVHPKLIFIVEWLIVKWDLIKYKQLTVQYLVCLDVAHFGHNML
jgi:hypothetical protein